MCGIAGYFSREGFAPEEGRALLEKMAGALSHRGPDDRGFFTSRHCGLASTRLSIIDLEHGRMPIFNEDRTIAVVFNGEIYNHAALRSELSAKAHVFATRTDTETLVHAYEDRGAELCPSLNGMFAFALWDENKKRLLLARDRFGIKPLLTAVSRDGKLLLFASEAKALLETGLIDRRFDPRAVADVFSAGYPMPPHTMFAGVQQLSPASTRVLEVGGADKSSNYWTMPYGQVSDAPLEETAELLRSTLDTAVGDHLIADVPVGSYLSGGIDSISIATLAARRMDRKLQTFSMGFSTPDAAYDESDIATWIAQTIGSDHRRVEITGITREDYEGTIAAMEAPQVHTVAFCLYQLSRAVKNSGLKVVLTGEGSDEIFAGYGAFRLRRMRRWFGGWARPIRDLFLKLIVAVSGKKTGIVSSLLRWSEHENAVLDRYGVVPPWIEQWWLLLEESAAIAGQDTRAMLAAENGVQSLPATIGGPSSPVNEPHLQRELRFEQQTRLAGWVLALGDRLTMAHSVEARVPFLDPRVAELSAKAPPHYLLAGRKEKFLLRQAMKTTIPEGAWRRKKRAFMAPITRWLFRDPLPELVRDAFSHQALEKTGLFDPQAIDERMKYLASGKRDLRALRISWALNVALGMQVMAEKFRATL